MRRRPDPAAPWRGAATALLTAALAVGAHAMASNVAPTGSGMALIGVLACTFGALAASTARPPGAIGLLATLALGQALCHLVLALSAHAHHDVTPSTIMTAAHAAALTVGALMIAAADRLWCALGTVVCALPTARPPLVARIRFTAAASDQPLHRMLLLAASVSHRGPPVSAAR